MKNPSANQSKSDICICFISTQLATYICTRFIVIQKDWQNVVKNFKLMLLLRISSVFRTVPSMRFSAYHNDCSPQMHTLTELLSSNGWWHQQPPTYIRKAESTEFEKLQKRVEELENRMKKVQDNNQGDRSWADITDSAEKRTVQEVIEKSLKDSVPPWWPGSSSKIIKVNGYVRHNFI